MGKKTNRGLTSDPWSELLDELKNRIFHAEPHLAIHIFGEIKKRAFSEYPKIPILGESPDITKPYIIEHKAVEYTLYQGTKVVLLLTGPDKLKSFKIKP